MKEEIKRQIDHVSRGVEQIVPMTEFEAKIARSIKEKKPLRVKLGIDPNRPHVHLGHTVPFRTLRRFQELGHTAVIIIGNYTAQVGDPSGKSEMRPQVAEEEVEKNAQLFLGQLAKIIDLSKAEITRNGDWFKKMSFLDVLRLQMNITVAQMLERDDFSKRYASATPIGLHEFMYPLMQGWDSVEVRADIELGGTEQLFNLNVGRQLQKEKGQEPQVCMLLPILVGTDGVRRMGKSLGNYIGISEDPKEIFGKIMSVPDSAMPLWFELLTNIPKDEIKNMLAGHPRDAKVHLAMDIITQFHNGEAAAEAHEQFNKVFSQGALPDEIPVVPVPASEFKDGKIWIVKLLTLCGFFNSNGEARRAIQQGGISINQVKTSETGDISVKDGDILSAGKRKFAKIKIQ